ncbi:triose-phosphate isomerase [Chromobacterium subtsugae]|uniref:Triosephosphate isomerase n=1 Tax=Chromobacterium subtsugae TaxID=251747 RepID=A0ABS7FCK5_9NEIS|nr:MULTISPECIES: triose-phosphate isomerase [Chromobacterium]MBW7566337.1 triose-phosphate isomerase [Chromobacterium subtsugae]MBW8287804.1 triose-phosphate isomerase [Chromobacterium subtsugae]OBU85619.1 triosephosphate isomerase [Chromobacterium subtsugae]WSE91134.1 triose-phosphate isomerase [Chromobacterium subtsugae]WVH59508.1 triose-phosphate isomerase [Chromobacterium subtsugae]
MSGKLVIGNWKMNTRGDSAGRLAAELLADQDTNREGVGIAAPAVYLAALAAQLRGSHIALSAQDVSRYDADGAFTGEVSAAMLADVGCRYALVGHSERRQYFAEDNASLLKKMRHAIAAGLVPVLCVGETLEQREAGQYLEVVRGQLALLAEIGHGDEYVVAYEPVWAIGTGKVATLEQIAEIHAFIKNWCLQNAGGSAKIRVLYGGSVKAENAESILATENVDGALVGGASLDARSFRVICQAAGKMI